jgi:pilus assembly protein Flp/PilA
MEGRMTIRTPESVIDCRGEQGASAVEFGLLVGMIAAVIITAMLIFGDFVGDVFTSSCETMDAGATAVSGADCT